jgi:4-hydroxyproline epimerase
MNKVRCIDSHTAGEPTRVVLDLPWGDESFSPEQAADWLRVDGDGFRRSAMLEPRGGEQWVGALLLPPQRADSSCGVVFFNNVGVLGMCGHGTMGLVRTLEYLGRVGPGRHRIETPVGLVEATLETSGQVSVKNVRSRRIAEAVTVEVPAHGPVTGDVAYGGNGFFLVENHGFRLALEDVESLTQFSKAVRRAVNTAGYTEVDHVELMAPPVDPQNHGRNFVLCPGGAYDRSPCGTGTSAKVACLMADGKLGAGESWRQEGILGTVFEATAEMDGDGVIPTVTGRAWVTAETTLVIDDGDPFAEGIVGAERASEEKG